MCCVFVRAFQCVYTIIRIKISRTNSQNQFLESFNTDRKILEDIGEIAGNIGNYWEILENIGGR